MAAINPPGFLQNAGATHNAEQFRDWHGLLVAGKTSTTSLVSRGGVHPALGNTLQVTQTGSPSMGVVVKSGMAIVPGSEGTKQGVYSCLNDADVTLTIAAAHATLNRIDIVCFKVEDQAYSGSVNSSSLVVVTGTPNASPSAPAAPNNSITLAQVSIVANDTSITNGEITDKRPYLAATGGVINCTSTTRPAANTVNNGQLIYETDTNSLLKTVDGGTTWTGAASQIISRGTRSATKTGMSTLTGVVRIDGVPTINGESYRVDTGGITIASTLNENMQFFAALRIDTTGAAATTASTPIAQVLTMTDAGNGIWSGELSTIHKSTVTGTMSILMTFTRIVGGGTASIFANGTATGPEIWVERLGATPTNAGIDV